MTHLFALALFQPAPSGSSGGAMPLTGILFQIGAFVAIFYFLLIRPQQKQRKQQEQLILTIKKGDEIVTAGGIVAHVVHIQQKMVDGVAAPSVDDLITIKSGESKLVIERSKVAKVTPKSAEATTSA